MKKNTESHPLVFASTYMDILSKKVGIITIPDITILEEMGIWYFLHRTTLSNGKVNVLLKTEYFDSQEFIYDLAFISGRLVDIVTKPQMTNMLCRMINSAKSNKTIPAFLQEVNKVVKEHKEIKFALEVVTQE